MTPKFSPGDKVRVKACLRDMRKVGMVGEIVERARGESYYQVRLDAFGLSCFEPRDLEIVKETTT